MHIAIDASRTTLAARTGTENYALQLIRALLDIHPTHRITLYFRTKPHPQLFNAYPNVTQHILPYQRLWTHLHFAKALWQDRPDVVFVPAHTLPIAFPGRAVVTVHDLGYRFFPDAHPRLTRYYLDLTTRYSARRATRILADSQATMRDLMGQYGIPASKIEVIYPGVEQIERASEIKIAAVKQRYRLPARYLLFLGTLQPRKNLHRLLQAFVHFANTEAGQDVSLVLAGKRGWLIERVLDEVIGAIPPSLQKRIIFPGYIDDNDIAGLYSGALALVFPSLYEGFGFPVLEAMHCDTPVVCSQTSSLPELAGDAALLVNPLDVGQLAAAMERIVTDEELRNQLRTRAAQQIKPFTWRIAAERTLRVLEQAGGRK